MRWILVTALLCVGACAGTTPAPTPTPAPSEPTVSPELPAPEAPIDADAQGGALAEHAIRTGARRVVVLYDRDLAAAGELDRAFAERFEESGGQVLARWRFTPRGLPAATRALGEMLPVDAVVLAAGEEQVMGGVRGIRATGFDGPILGGIGFGGVEWIDRPDFGEIVFAAPTEDGDSIGLWRVEDGARVSLPPP
jgi:ABC-type branched-subunit amino acid transport system substrate-binding protein